MRTTERRPRKTVGPAGTQLRHELETLVAYARRLDVPLAPALSGLLELRRHVEYADSHDNATRTGTGAVFAWAHAARLRLYRASLESRRHTPEARR